MEMKVADAKDEESGGKVARNSGTGAGSRVRPGSKKMKMTQHRVEK